MPTLGELGTLPNELSNSLISTTPLWKREASTITQTDILLFLQQYKRTEQYGQACREVSKVTDAGIEALISGDLKAAEFSFFEHQKIVFTSDELCEWMSCVSDARCKAILFGLDMKMDPKDVIGLAWQETKDLRLTPLAREIIISLPRHMHLKYVFWDYLSNGSAAPLFGLAESALEVSQGLGFGVLQDLYERMIITDAETELNHFLSQFNLELDSRIGK